MRRLEPDDQASGLRRLLGDQNVFRSIGLFGPDAVLNAAVAANLGVALSMRGGRVCLIDEAPGPHNVAGQFGLTPRFDLTDVAHGRQTLNGALTEIPEGPALLSAERGLECLSDADDRYWSRLAGDFADSDWEWLLMAAPTTEAPCLALTAPRRILVLPAAKSRLAEAYVVLKTAHQKQPDAQWSALFMEVTDDHRAVQIMASLNETTRRFLDIEVALLGMVPKDEKLDIALRTMRPLHEVSPSAPASQAFRRAAARLHEESPDAGAGMDARVFWQRLGLFSRLNRPPSHQTSRHVQHGRAYG